MVKTLTVECWWWWGRAGVRQGRRARVVVREGQVGVRVVAGPGEAHLTFPVETQDEVYLPALSWGGGLGGPGEGREDSLVTQTGEDEGRETA